MAYYNRLGKPLRNLNKMEYLRAGECASIYHNSEIIFKEYFSETPQKHKLKEDVFDILKDIDNPNFIKLLEIYSNMNLQELVQLKTHMKKFIVDAYTAKYYDEKEINPLYETVDYLLDNFHELEKLFDLFTSNSIIVDDTKRENTIITKERIILIDPDSFYISTKVKEKIAFNNKTHLLILFKSIWTHSMPNIENQREALRDFYTKISDIPIDSTTNITYELSKKLKYVKKPIDYVII